MTITTVGIALAKNVFAVHCVDQHGKTVLVKPKVSRAALPELIASLPSLCYREWIGNSGHLEILLMLKQ